MHIFASASASPRPITLVIVIVVIATAANRILLCTWLRLWHGMAWHRPALTAENVCEKFRQHIFVFRSYNSKWFSLWSVNPLDRTYSVVSIRRGVIVVSRATRRDRETHDGGGGGDDDKGEEDEDAEKEKTM